ncbi:unnamed protein product, partial [Polarella glacialis]
ADLVQSSVRSILQAVSKPGFSLRQSPESSSSKNDQQVKGTRMRESSSGIVRAYSSSRIQNPQNVPRVTARKLR